MDANDTETDKKKDSFLFDLVFAQYGMESLIDFISFKKILISLVSFEYHQLIELSKSLPRDEDNDRKIKLVQYFSQAKNRFVQVLVLKRFVDNVKCITDLHRLFVFVRDHTNVYYNVANRLTHFVLNVLSNTKVPMIDYRNMVRPCKFFPTYYKEKYGNEKITTQDDMFKEKSKCFLEEHLACAEYDMPEFDTFSIKKGIMTCSIKGKYMTKIMHSASDGAWLIAKVQILLRTASSSLSEYVELDEIQERTLKAFLEIRMKKSEKPLLDMHNSLMDFVDHLVLEILYTQICEESRKNSQNLNLVKYIPFDHIKISIWNSPLSFYPIYSAYINAVDYKKNQYHSQMLQGLRKCIVIRSHFGNIKLEFDDDYMENTDFMDINLLSINDIINYCTKKYVSYYNNMIIEKRIALSDENFEFIVLKDSSTDNEYFEYRNVILNKRIIFDIDESSGFYNVVYSNIFVASDMQNILKKFSKLVYHKPHEYTFSNNTIDLTEAFSEDFNNQFFTFDMILEKLFHMQKYFLIEYIREELNFCSTYWSTVVINNNITFCLVLQLKNTHYSLIFSNIQGYDKILNFSIHDNFVLNIESRRGWNLDNLPCHHNGSLSINDVIPTSNLLTWFKNLYEIFVSFPIIQYATTYKVPYLLEEKQHGLFSKIYLHNFTSFLNDYDINTSSNEFYSIRFPLWKYTDSFGILVQSAFDSKFITKSGKRNTNFSGYKFFIKHKASLIEDDGSAYIGDEDKKLFHLKAEFAVYDLSFEDLSSSTFLHTILCKLSMRHVHVYSNFYALSQYNDFLGHVKSLTYCFENIVCVLSIDSSYKIVILDTEFLIKGVDAFCFSIIKKKYNFKIVGDVLSTINDVVYIIEALCSLSKGLLEVKSWDDQLKILYPSMTLYPKSSDFEGLLNGKHYLKLELLDNLEYSVADTFTQFLKTFNIDELNCVAKIDSFDASAMPKSCFSSFERLEANNSILLKTRSVINELFYSHLFNCSYNIAKYKFCRRLFCSNRMLDTKSYNVLFAIKIVPKCCYLALNFESLANGPQFDNTTEKTLISYFFYLQTSPHVQIYKLLMFHKLLMKSEHAVIQWLSPIFEWEMKSSDEMCWKIEWTNSVSNCVALTSNAIKNNFIYPRRVLAKAIFVHKKSKKQFLLVFAHDFKMSLSTCYLWKESIMESLFSHEEKNAIICSLESFIPSLDKNFSLKTVLDLILLALERLSSNT